MKNNILLSFQKFKKTTLINKIFFFINKILNKNEISLSFGDATTNIMIFGGTGTGKTTAICYPVVYNLISNDCSGLIIDVKGGYSHIARHFNSTNDKCLILGVETDCSPVNLIGGISPYKLREFLKEAIVNNQSNEYWGSNGIEDIVLIYELLLSINKNKCPTLADLYFFAVDNFNLKKVIAKCDDYDIMKKMRMRRESDSFSLFSLNISSNDTSQEQKTWQLSSLLNCLKYFYEDENLNNYFCNNDFLDFDHIIYEKKQTIVLDLPTSHFSNVSLFVSKILRARFRDTIKNKGESKLQQSGYGNKLFTFLLIDEYQQYISTRTSLSADDNNWLDTSRGYGHINILSTQSVDSLIAKSDEASAHQLIGNCRNIIHLGSNAKHSLEHLLSLSNEQIKNSVRSQYDDCGFLYIGKRNLTRKGVSSLITTGQSNHRFMNYFIKNPIKHIETRKEESTHYSYENNYINYEINNTSSKKNIYIYLNKSDKKKKVINKDLTIITTEGKSDGFIDFNFILEEKNISFKSINVLSIINKNQLPESILEEKAIFNNNSLIVFVRGGSEFEDSFLDKKTFVDFFQKKKKETGCMLGIAIGHAPHLFKFDLLVDIYGITPTDLAYKISEYEFTKNQPKTVEDQIKDIKKILEDEKTEKENIIDVINDLDKIFDDD